MRRVPEPERSAARNAREGRDHVKPPPRSSLVKRAVCVGFAGLPSSDGCMMPQGGRGCAAPRGSWTRTRP